MKKLFFILAASLIAFSFTSCENYGGHSSSDPSSSSDKDKPLKFTISVPRDEITETSAHIIITPSDPYEEYCWLMFPKEFLMDEKGNIGSLNQYVQDLAHDGSSYESYKRHYPVQIGKFDQVFNELDPGIQYFVCAFCLDSNLNIVRDYVASEFFTTLDEQEIAGYVDFGLPSGTLWAEESAGTGYYTINEAKAEYGNRLPTKEQWQELIDNCNWEWKDDEKGYLVSSKTDPKTNIFLDTFGYMNSNGEIINALSRGYYWSRTEENDKTLGHIVYCMIFKESRYEVVFFDYNDVARSVWLVK